MASSATTTVDLTAAPTEALDAVRRVISDNKHRLVAESPDGSQVDFVTRKTMLSWELEARATIAPHGAGSQVTLLVDTAPGRPKALLDGKKNKKSVEKLADQVRAAAG
jgi:hypothetical protein